jgi:hypothetical protein
MVSVCCCSPEITHNETTKFMIIERDFEREREIAKAAKSLPRVALAVA